MEIIRSISWTQYTLVMGLCLLLYYSFVIYRYFSPQVQQLLGGNRPGVDFQNEFDHTSGTVEEIAVEEEDFSPVDDALFDRAQELMDKLKQVLNEAAVGGLAAGAQEDLLRKEIKNYPDLNIQAFRPGINYMIQSESDKLGSVMLDERELARLWTS